MKVSWVIVPFIWLNIEQEMQARINELFWAELIRSGWSCFLGASSCFDIAKKNCSLGTRHFKHLILGWQDRRIFSNHQTSPNITKPNKHADMPELQLIHRHNNENAQSLIPGLGVSHHRQQRLRFLLPGKTTSYGTGKGASRVEENAGWTILTYLNY